MGLPSESQPPIGSLHQFFPILYSFWSRAENRNSPRSGASQARLTRAKRQLLRLQKLILYINTGILGQAILRKLQQNVLLVHGLNLRDD